MNHPYDGQPFHDANGQQPYRGDHQPYRRTGSQYPGGQPQYPGGQQPYPVQQSPYGSPEQPYIAPQQHYSGEQNPQFSPNQRYDMGEAPPEPGSFSPYFQEAPESTGNNKWWTLCAGIVVVLIIIAAATTVILLNKGSSDNSNTQSTDSPNSITTTTTTTTTTSDEDDLVDPTQFATDYYSNGTIDSSGGQSEKYKMMICPNSPEMRGIEEVERSNSAWVTSHGSRGTEFLEARIVVLDTKLLTLHDDSAEVDLMYTITLSSMIDGTPSSHSNTRTSKLSLNRRNSSWCVYDTTSPDDTTTPEDTW